MRFNSLQTGKQIQRAPILSPVGPWLRTPKTIRELRGAIFERNFSPKIPQTHVCIELYAIFWAKRLKSQVTPMFLGDFCCVRTRLVHRVCGICLKYTRNPEKCQTDISQKHSGVSIDQGSLNTRYCEKCQSYMFTQYRVCLSVLQDF